MKGTNDFEVHYFSSDRAMSFPTHPYPPVASVRLTGGGLSRAEFERAGGSLVLHHVPATMPSFDAWGTPGDALPLMRAIKMQFDPKSTLNPGRFVGGI